MTNRLLPEQRDRFVRNGFIVLSGTIPQSILDGTVDVVAETVPEDLTDFEELVAGPEDRHYWNDLTDMVPFRPLNEQLHRYAEELVGTDRLEPPTEFTQVAVRYPEGEFASTAGHSMTPIQGNPHVDIFQDSGDLHSFTIGTTTYLDDVHPRSGGLTVWPGTHWRIAEHLSEHDVEEYSNETVDGIVGSGFESSAFEVTGAAGTVVLWHPLLVHTGGIHLGRRPRIATFTRFQRHDEGETSHDAARNPFKYWNEVDG